MLRSACNMSLEDPHIQPPEQTAARDSSASISSIDHLIEDNKLDSSSETSLEEDHTVEHEEERANSAQPAKLNIGAPVSRSIGSKLRKAREEKEAAKRSPHAAAFRGWKEVTGYDDSFALSPVDEIMDLLTRSTSLEEILPENLYGEWFHGVGALLTACLLSSIVGYFRLSLGPVFFITIIFGLYYRSSIRKYRLNLRLQAQREFSVHAIEDDFESLDWLNVFLDKYWVYLEPSISQQITEIVNPMVAELDAIPAFVREIWIQSLTLGTKPPRVDRVRTLDRTADDVTVMDWTFSLIPNAQADTTVKQMRNHANFEIIVKAKIFGVTVPVLISNISMRADARIRLRMMSNFPHIQTVNVSLSDTPDFDFIFKIIGSNSIFGFELFNIPGLYMMVKEMVKKYLGPMLFQPLSFELNLEQLLAGNGASGALGILELNVKSAEGLVAADTFNNTIDPYFTFGFQKNVKAKTKIVYDTMNPIYNETIRVILNSSSDPLAIKLYDENISDGRKDKFMGAALYDLDELISKTELKNLKIPILRNNYPAGSINLDIKYMKSLQGSKLPDGSFSPPPDYNTGVAKIVLSGARSFTSKDDEKKSVYAQLYLSGEKRLETPVAKNSNEASWSCDFEEIIYDRSKARVRVILRESSKENKILGSATLRLVDIIDASYVGNSWFPLSNNQGEIEISCNWNSVRIPGVKGALGYSEPFGVLRVYIEKASDLVRINKVGSIDPYFRVLVNGLQKGRTLTMDSTYDPKYYQSMYIPVSSVNQRITIEGMDVARHGQDRTLGSFQIRLNEFIDYNNEGKPIETSGELKEAKLFHRRKGAKGSVTYSIAFYPIKQVVTPEEAETEKKEAAELQAKIDAEEKKASNDKKDRSTEELSEQNNLALDTLHKDILPIEDIAKFDTGVLVFTLLGSKFSNSGYFQVFFDKNGYPEYETSISGNTNLQRTFDYLVKEMQKYSLMTFRIVEKKNTPLTKNALKEITVPTIKVLEHSYGKQTSLNIGDSSNTISFTTKFLPAMISSLPPADSIGNSGTLNIEFVGARELLSKDSNGKSDPFVKAYLNGDEFYKSKTIKKTLEPTWNESTSISIDSRVQSVIRFKVNDWDFGLEQDDKIGEYTYALKQLDPFDTEMKDYNFELIGEEGQYAGTLEVRMSFKPEYHTLLSAEKSLPNPGNIAIDGAGKILNTPGKVLGTASKIGSKAFGVFKKKHHDEE